MIKVNFKKTKSPQQTEVVTEATGLGLTGTLITNLKTTLEQNTSLLSPGLIVKFILNIVFVACFPLGLKIYEQKGIKELERQKKQEETTLAQTNAKLAQVRKGLENQTELNELSQEFKEKKDFLKGLSHKRLIVPKILDFIQSHIPRKRVWLKNVNIDISGKTQKVSISGESFKEGTVNSFAVSLRDILDENSITVSTRDIKNRDSIVKISFKLDGSIN